MRPNRYPKVLVFACTLTLVALGLMSWSVLVPTPMPVMVAMSAGQALGTVSLLLFIWVVIDDLRRTHRAARRARAERDRESEG